jgi:hypothetical protein
MTRATVSAAVAACLMALAAASAAAAPVTLTIPDTTVIWPAPEGKNPDLTGPAGVPDGIPDDRYGYPTVDRMYVTYDGESRRLLRVVMEKTTHPTDPIYPDPLDVVVLGESRDFDTLFINTNVGEETYNTQDWPEMQKWDYFVRHGFRFADATTWFEDGYLFKINTSYQYFVNNDRSDRRGHVNTIQKVDGVQIISPTSSTTRLPAYFTQAEGLLDVAYEPVFAGIPMPGPGYFYTEREIYDFTTSPADVILGDINVFGWISECANDVMLSFVIVVVPEPATAALVALGTLAAVLRRR